MIPTDISLILFDISRNKFQAGDKVTYTGQDYMCTKCLDKYEKQHQERRYFFVTMLRDPVQRYLSEFNHVQRGATWKKVGNKLHRTLHRMMRKANWFLQKLVARMVGLRRRWRRRRERKREIIRG